jgi:Short C-terminal domain
MMVRRRRPLLRATMVGGVAYHAGNQRYSQAADGAPAPAGGLSEAAIAQLEELAQLRDAEALTQDEFDAQKAQILGS